MDLRLSEWGEHHTRNISLNLNPRSKETTPPPRAVSFKSKRGSKLDMQQTYRKEILGYEKKAEYGVADSREMGSIYHSFKLSIPQKIQASKLVQNHQTTLHISE